VPVHVSLLADASEPGRSRAFLVLLGCVLSFLFIRMSARMIRAEVAWWAWNVETASGLHLHHLVWGIGLMLVAGSSGSRSVAARRGTRSQRSASASGAA
jgi:hypothetical protein